ncbi:MAG: DUF4367 domain-containing protein [Ruminiclostridium sp.]|nr:DUF4367 domain-containing protein [Ruminiclostridium sp.]
MKKELSSLELKLLDKVIEEIPDIPDHKFSFRYMKRRRKIIDSYTDAAVNKPEFNRKYIIIAIIAACIIALSGFGLFVLFDGFRVTEYDTYSMLYIDEVTESPLTIENKFYIDMDLSGYKEEIIEEDKLGYSVKYQSENEYICVRQGILSISKQVRINTEEAMVMPEQCNVNGCYGIYFCSRYGAHVLFLNTGEYIVEYHNDVSKERVIEIAEATKFR